VVAVLGSSLAGSSGLLTWPGTANGTGLLFNGLYTVLVQSEQDASLRASVNVTAFTGPTYGLVVGSPTAGLVALKGSPLTTTFQAANAAVISAPVRLELMLSGVAVSTMASGVPAAQGTYVWLIPTTAAPSTGYSVRVTNELDGTIFAFSPTFTIVSGVLTWIFPPDSTQSSTVVTIYQAPGMRYNLTWDVKGSLVATGTVTIAWWMSCCSFGTFTTTAPAARGYWTFAPAGSTISMPNYNYFYFKLTSNYDVRAECGRVSPRGLA
jgi:hypothetical protein